MPSNLWLIHRDRIAGVWKCISYELRGSNGRVVAKPHGDKPLGRAQISLNGYVSGLVATPDRMLGPLPSGKSWQQGEDAEVAHVARGEVMYCGYLELFEDEKGLFWRTTVEVANDPGKIGGLEERRLEFVEDNGKCYLALTPKGEIVMDVGLEAHYQYARFKRRLLTAR